MKFLFGYSTVLFDNVYPKFTNRRFFFLFRNLEELFSRIPSWILLANLTQH